MMPCRTEICSIFILGAGPIVRSTPCPADPTRNQSKAPYVQAR